MKKLVLAAVSAIAFATPAFAEGFNGFRVEAHAGYDKVSADNALLDGSDDGVLYGLGIGYDTELSTSMVFGVEANADLTTAKRCESLGTEELCLKGRRVFDIGVRSGFKVNPTLLIYGKAAYANGRLKLTYTDSAFPGDNFSIADNADGVRIGAGIETLLGANGFAKVEYRYTDYSDGFSQNQVVLGAGFRF